MLHCALVVSPGQFSDTGSFRDNEMVEEALVKALVTRSGILKRGIPGERLCVSCKPGWTGCDILVGA